mgnify:CR=1 FL=1
MEKIQDVPIVSPEEGPENPRFESFHKSFLFETESATFSMLFKPQEELVPLSLLDKKSVVFVGDTPYARDQTKVRGYYDSLQEHTNFYTLQHSGERFGQKYHFSASERIKDWEWKDHRADTLLIQTPLKPETDLTFLQIEKLREAGKDARAEFIINSDAQSLIDAAHLIAKTYPDARKDNSLIGESVPQIEDYIVAASFNEGGKCIDAMDETRNQVIRALLGHKDAANFLKAKLEKNQEKFPPLKIKQLIDSRNAKKLWLVDLKERIRESEFGSSVKGQVQETEANLALLDTLIEKYQRGDFEVPEEIIQELDKYVAIHMTSYYPVFDEKSREWVIPTHSKATGDKVGRLSIHFSIDGIATATGMPTGDLDKWTGKPYAIVAPLGQMIKKNGLMDNFMPADSWWVVDPNSSGIRIPESATIVARTPQGKGKTKVQEETAHSLAHKPGKGINKATLNVSDEEFLNYVKEKYGAKLESLGNDTWNNAEKTRWEKRSLAENIRKINPFIWDTRHADTPEEIFERKNIAFLNAGLLADNNVQKSAETSLELCREKMIEDLNHQTLPHEGAPKETMVAREFARQMVKGGIL